MGEGWGGLAGTGGNGGAGGVGGGLGGWHGGRPVMVDQEWMGDGEMVWAAPVPDLALRAVAPEWVGSEPDRRLRALSGGWRARRSPQSRPARGRIACIKMNRSSRSARLSFRSNAPRRGVCLAAHAGPLYTRSMRSFLLCWLAVSTAMAIDDYKLTPDHEEQAECAARRGDKMPPWQSKIFPDHHARLVDLRARAISAGEARGGDGLSGWP